MTALRSARSEPDAIRPVPLLRNLLASPDSAFPFTIPSKARLNSQWWLLSSRQPSG
jgi:hypothetical protein